MAVAEAGAGGAIALLRSVRGDPVRFGVAAAVVGTAVIAWAAVARLGGQGAMQPMGMEGGPEALAFVGLWTLGMVAMMFPITLPTVFLYDHLLTTPARGERAPELSRGHRLVGAPLFLGGYLSMYALLGAAGYALLAAGGAGATMTPALPAAVLVGAGLYQASPLKDRCFAAVHSPFAIFARGWRPGLKGAFVMGARHGAVCVACCWALMAVMLVVGAMGLLWMAGLTVVLTLERSAGARGPQVSKVVAAGLIAAGVWVGAGLFA